jgi:hypothetical protein
MANPVLTYTIRSKDESKTGIDSAQKNATGLVGTMDTMRKSMEGVHKAVGLLVGEGALFGLGRALREVNRLGAECEAAFAKLNDGLNESAISAANFNRGVESTKAAIGGLISGALKPFRDAIKENLLDPWSSVIIKALTYKDIIQTTNDLIAKMKPISFSDYPLGTLENMLKADRELLSAITPKDWYQQSHSVDEISQHSQLISDIGAIEDAISLRKELDALRESETVPLTSPPYRVQNRRRPSFQIPSGEAPEEAPSYWASTGTVGPEFAAQAAFNAVAVPAMAGAVASFAQAAMAVDSIRVAMDPLAVVFKTMFDVLTPAIDSILVPIIGGLSEFGKMIGELINPFLRWFGDLLAPFINWFEAFFRIIEMVAAIFTWLCNIILDFGWNITHWDKQRNTAGDIGAQLTALATAPSTWGASGQTYMAAHSGTTGGGSGTPTYSAQNISVVVNAQGAYISDLRDFALLIQREINAAGNLGQGTAA